LIAFCTLNRFPNVGMSNSFKEFMFSSNRTSPVISCTMDFKKKVRKMLKAGSFFLYFTFKIICYATEIHGI
jgi:hypothetical protein